MSKKFKPIEVMRRGKAIGEVYRCRPGHFIADAWGYHCYLTDNGEEGARSKGEAIGDLMGDFKEALDELKVEHKRLSKELKKWK